MVKLFENRFYQLKFHIGVGLDAHDLLVCFRSWETEKELLLFPDLILQEVARKILLLLWAIFYLILYGILLQQKVSSRPFLLLHLLPDALIFEGTYNVFVFTERVLLFKILKVSRA